MARPKHQIKLTLKAPLPPNEAQRLETLRGYNVLDTPPELAFDDLTLLAAQICQVPIAVVSLVDENRQWFKSIIGLSATETSRDAAFCAHAILNSDELLEVRDAQLDPRFTDNPLVTADPHIRFYAGAPLVAPDGLALGTLCVIDRVPRVLNAEQQNALRALSRTVIAQLELRRTLAAHRRAEEQLQSLNVSLDQKIEARSAQLKNAYHRLERLTKLYAALSQCNQAILRCASEAELFPQICRDAVQFGGMKMAWIGLVDEANQRVNLVASFGDGMEYLEGIQISVDAADPVGRGPTGTSIREDQPTWCQDFQHDPTTAPWHENG
ncbi:MAG: GAF domain-containing protein, partial [Gallionella sp.]